MVHQGYLPVVIRDLVSDYYLKMISDAQDKMPLALCELVAQTQLEMMASISLRLRSR